LVRIQAPLLNGHLRPPGFHNMVSLEVFDSAGFNRLNLSHTTTDMARTNNCEPT